jgi:hypothetical protein
LPKYKYPCLNCTDRFVGCHSSCKKYKVAKLNAEKEKADILKIKDEEIKLFDIKIDGMKRMRNSHSKPSK